MQKNKRRYLIAIALSLAGCATSDKPVYVDVNRLLSEEPTISPSTLNLPNPPATDQIPVVSIKGEAPVTLRDPSNTPKLNVKEMFREEQAKSFAELRKRLRAFYDLEAKRFRIEQERTITESERKAFQAANEEIRAAFERWAYKRATPFAQLALYAGFPIRIEESPNHEVVVRRDLRARAKEISDLNAQLKALDAEFKAESSAILSRVLDQTSADRAALLLKIERHANDLDAQAEQAAQAQIRSAVSTLDFKLADIYHVHLPATPQRSVSMGGAPTSFDRPVVPSDQSGVNMNDRKQILLSELKIWAALNRYELVPSSKGGIDLTNEFRIWRRSHEAAR